MVYLCRKNKTYIPEKAMPRSSVNGLSESHGLATKRDVATVRGSAASLFSRCCSFSLTQQVRAADSFSRSYIRAQSYRNWSCGSYRLDMQEAFIHFAHFWLLATHIAKAINSLLHSQAPICTTCRGSVEQGTFHPRVRPLAQAVANETVGVRMIELTRARNARDSCGTF